MQPDVAEREKRQVTRASVLAALGLTALKLWAGVASGSLALLAEAAHSALDLVASLITFLAVRWAARPPDEDHPYGHGKVENLAALVQALLLAATAAWVMAEAGTRIGGRSHPVQPGPAAFLVLGLSILVDAWRSRRLRAVGRRYRSQALEADALNFAADMWTSAAVLLGLALAAWGRRTGAPGAWARADAAAALGVGLVVLVQSLRLATRAVQVLLDGAPRGLRRRIAEAARRVEGVLGVGPVRLRQVGGRVFADLVVTVPRTFSLAQAHRVSDRVEASVRALEPGADVVVHVEPAPEPGEPPVEGVRALALQLGMRTHEERVYAHGGRIAVSLHLELDPRLPLARAHAEAARLERALREAYPGLDAVDIHLEPVAAPGAERRVEVTATEAPRVEELRAVAERAAAAPCPDVRLYRVDGGPGACYDASVRCRLPADLPLEACHERVERVEQELRRRFPWLRHVTVGAEPDRGGPAAGGTGAPPPPSLESRRRA